MWRRMCCHNESRSYCFVTDNMKEWIETSFQLCPFTTSQPLVETRLLAMAIITNIYYPRVYSCNFLGIFDLHLTIREMSLQFKRIFTTIWLKEFWEKQSPFSFKHWWAVAGQNTCLGSFVGIKPGLNFFVMLHFWKTLYKCCSTTVFHSDTQWDG